LAARRHPRFWSGVDWVTLISGWLGAACATLALARLIDAKALGDQHWEKSTTLILLGAGLGFGLLAGFNWRLCHRPRRRRDNDQPDLVVAKRPRADFDILSAAVLAIDTSRFSTRAVETIRIEDGFYRHSLNREFELPTATDPPNPRHLPIVGDVSIGIGDIRERATFLLPVIRISRDVLIDNLEVRDADGRRVSTLNIAEYYGLIARVVRSYVKLLSDHDKLTPEQQASIEVMLEGAGFIDPEAPGDPEVARAAREALGDDPFAWIWTLELSPERENEAAKWEPVRARLYQFCRAVHDAYIVFAPVAASPGERVVLAYSYTRTHRPRQHGMRDRVRYRLGLRPHEHGFTLAEHRWSQSYHLEFWAPPDQYVYSTDARPLRRRSRQPGSVVEFFPDGQQGADYVHVYVREADRRQYRTRDEILFEADCRERPPGMLGNIMVVAFAEALLIWVVGWHLSDFFPAGQSNAATASGELPALLLAVPGIVVGFLGAQFTGDKLRTTSMATMWGLISCGLIAIGSTTAALAKSSGDAFGAWLHVDHPIWLGFMIVSAVLAGDLFLRNWLRSRRFSKRINEECPMSVCEI
jgi:hypothetical protein